MSRLSCVMALGVVGVGMVMLGMKRQSTKRDPKMEKINIKYDN